MNKVDSIGTANPKAKGKKEAEKKKRRRREK
jgi:hypothetical protein